MVMNLTATKLLVQNDFLFTPFTAALVMFPLRAAELRSQALRRWTISGIQSLY